MANFTLKATEKDRSGAIILSFHAKWDVPLRERKISVVFRKDGPRRFNPDWLYAYLTAPVSAITAKMPVTSYRKMALDEAVKLAPEGLLTEEGLRAYASAPYSASYSELVVFRIGEIQAASSPVTMRQLQTEFSFWPSPTYIPLSEAGKATLDRLAKFGE